ncbi:uncharacterized protein MONBRDRAFT_33295 [Monosiga brevicollis MX1]|uniref:ATP-grasp domain-containing protein n=1 Tax=Monosiga brevicollis TaxID=81824 RepID=A9V4L4_MONBE|nr:uncharacterized protein MONBRDRAFT_33295 [Monosiga brevicollis MX1]EDQ87391.1 predicted protein [Monosiga brevicollis MX1]|eukprot:XP_001747651.1 hypothetical protein [Monosiga brevicollis MX1]
MALQTQLEKMGAKVLIHKLTDQLARLEQGDTTAETLVHQLEAWTASGSQRVLDPLPRVRPLVDRGATLGLLEQLSSQLPDGFAIPPSRVAHSAPQAAGWLTSALRWPLIVKPLPAHGSSDAHRMCIVNNLACLEQLSYPVLCQNFYDHDALLYKVFVLGDRHHVVPRPSIRNVDPAARGEATLMAFDSHDVSKAHSQTYLNDAVAMKTALASNVLRRPDLALLADRMRQHLGLTLFGFDVAAETSVHYIVDVNYFPGYKGIESFQEDLCHLLRQTVDSLE